MHRHVLASPHYHGNGKWVRCTGSPVLSGLYSYSVDRGSQSESKTGARAYVFVPFSVTCEHVLDICFYHIYPRISSHVLSAENYMGPQTPVQLDINTV